MPSTSNNKMTAAIEVIDDFESSNKIYSDYGHYNDLAIDNQENLSTTSESFDVAEGTTILCVVENSKAPVACRSFEEKITHGTVSIRISVPGFRIICKRGEQLVEYKVKLRIQDKEFVAWRQYEHFQTLAEAFSIFNSIQHPKDQGLMKILSAWKEVVNNRPWFPTSLKMSFLLKELKLLEIFLEIALFEIPHFNLFEEFVC
mmetsp:Transcript_11690/g.16064  ORF Transcript_11690/g.16064 Transcript_11690/m.16064 type:complete len:202 (+) Transcript_11690:30-635(+)